VCMRLGCNKSEITARSRGTCKLQYGSQHLRHGAALHRPYTALRFPSPDAARSRPRLHMPCSSDTAKVAAPPFAAPYTHAEQGSYQPWMLAARRHDWISD